MKFSNPNINENFLNGLRGGMNELFTDFKKQFEKLETSKQDMYKQADGGFEMDFAGEENKEGADKKTNNSLKDENY